MKLFDDTPPEAGKVYVRLLSQAPAWKKMEIVNQLYLTAVSMARAGIRRRHPDADEDEIRRRLARMFLGEELARKVYGPVPEGEE